MSSNTVRHYILLISWFLFICNSQSVAAKHNAYCKLPNCGTHNLACLSPETFSAACPANAAMVSLRPFKALLLDHFNTFRNKVAAGYTKTLFPAGRMARMVWSNELENFAKMDIRICQIEPRPCMSSSQFTLIGSIIDAVTIGERPNARTLQEVLQQLIEEWMEEARLVTRDLLMNLTPTFKRSNMRRAMLLMADRNTHVGCSALQAITGYATQYHVSCTFATENLQNKPIYKVAPKPGKLCRRRDTTYKNLCALGEAYGNNRRYKDGDILPAFATNYGAV